MTAPIAPGPRDPADALIGRVTAQRDLMAALDDELGSLSARVRSRDGTVTAEVDGVGALTGLWLGPRARHHGAAALARLIVDTAAAAAEVTRSRQQFLVGEFVERLGALRERPPDRAVTEG